MTKFAAVFALIAMTHTVWSQELSDCGPWSLPKVESTCWVSAMTACKFELVLSLDGSELAATQYDQMSQALKMPLERQIMAKVQYDVLVWWQSSPSHTKKGLFDTIAKSISVLPSTMKCRVKVVMLMVRPSPATSEGTNCQVQPPRLHRFFIYLEQNALFLL